MTELKEEKNAGGNFFRCNALLGDGESTFTPASEFEAGAVWALKKLCFEMLNGLIAKEDEIERLAKKKKGDALGYAVMAKDVFEMHRVKYEAEMLWSRLPYLRDEMAGESPNAQVHRKNRP